MTRADGFRILIYRSCEGLQVTAQCFQIDDLVDAFLIANINQHPLGTIKHQIHAATQSLARLQIDLNDMRKDFATSQHE